MTSLGTEGHYDNASNEEDDIQGGVAATSAGRAFAQQTSGP
jgi:hypothetical protein